MSNSQNLTNVLTLLAAGFTGVALAADTGDAPESYGLASHEVVVSAPFIGNNPPDNNDPVSGALADGDDLDGATDDEDGVFGFPTLVQNGKSYTTNVFVSNPAVEPAFLTAWVDFDGNGVFEQDESVSAIVPAGADNEKVKLVWNDLTSVTTDFTGPTYARFRISASSAGAANPSGTSADGEVEDYTFDILPDVDGDEIPDGEDLDNDNDGIPDTVEIVGTDSDSDGTPDYLDVDSDNDTIPDFVEAGSNPGMPADSDADGIPDYIDLDSNNDGTPDQNSSADDEDGDDILDVLEGAFDSDADGVVNSLDLDSDNDTIPDALEVGDNPATPADSDGDGVADFLDLDSDNDGLPDFREGSSGEVDINPLDLDFDGQVDSGSLTGANGLVDLVETDIDSGIPRFAVPDTDGDGVRDYIDTDSDNDSAFDIVEAGGVDADGNGLVDGWIDTDSDGIPDQVDASITGGVDSNNNGIDDVFDAGILSQADADNDGIIDDADIDPEGDGFINGSSNMFIRGEEPFDLNDNNIPDFRDAEQQSSLDVNNNGANPPAPRLQTGLSGFAGCTITSVRGVDPTLPLLLVICVLWIFNRRHSL